MTYGVEPWPGKHPGWMPYITIQHSGQPEDRIRIPVHYESREAAMKTAKLTAHLYLQRLGDGS